MNCCHTGKKDKNFEKLEKMLAISIWICIFIIILMFAFFSPKKSITTGCCQIGIEACAEGPAVTKEMCIEQLKGKFTPNTICNLNTGKCQK